MTDSKEYYKEETIDTRGGGVRRNSVLWGVNGYFNKTHTQKNLSCLKVFKVISDTMLSDEI